MPAKTVWSDAMEAIILSVGNELTAGQTLDTNAAWLSQQLSELGIGVLRHVTLADELEPIRRELERACEQADVVLISGGLGPTVDDLTRQALAEAMGVPLELREEFVERIRAFFTARSRSMPETNVVQAQFPAGSEPIANTCGTAPGIRARCKRAAIFAMPGVPREMREMYRRDVRPRLIPQTGGAAILAATLNCFGAGESDIAEKIVDLMERGKNPAVGTTARQGVIGVRILARGSRHDEARALLDEMVNEVRRRLGPLVFGRDDETLASAVAQLLTSAGKTIATAESCTGGLIAKRLTDIPGSSVYFRDGVVTYANEAKTRLLGVPAELIERHGAVSAPVAEAMALGCRQRSRTDFAISVTGIAGPQGGTPDKPVGLVYIGLARESDCQVTPHRFGEFLGRGEIRDRTCNTALNRLRLRLG